MYIKVDSFTFAFQYYRALTCQKGLNTEKLLNSSQLQSAPVVAYLPLSPQVLHFFGRLHKNRESSSSYLGS